MKKLQPLRFLYPLILGFSCLLLLVFSHPGNAAKRSLIVAVEPVYPPFEFQAANGELQGFDIDLMREVGKAADFEVQFQSLPFDGIIPALQAGTVDAAVSAMTITPERSQVVSFSRPYFKAGLAIAVRTGTQEINSLEDLAGKKIAVQIGTTGAQTAKKIPNATIRTFDAAVMALQELSNGNVDAVINDAPVTLYAINTGNLKRVQIVGQLLTEEFYGIPTALNSPNLKLINQGLTTILENGTYERIYRKWFNADPPQLPATAFDPTGKTAATTASPLRVILDALPSLLAGAFITLQLAAISTLLGLIAGSLIGIARLSRVLPVRWAARAYIDFFRGTPLLVQIFMIYFGIPAVLKESQIDFSFDRFLAAVVALSLNSAAYIGEIVRAGIQSIDYGQSEAAQSLGLDSVQTMRYIIFPQAFRRMLPPLGNEFITLLKDTSLVAVIGFEELFRRGQLIVAENYRPFELYTAVALVYLALTLLSSQAFSFLERWMDPLRHRATKS
ncbi:amine acid ABC transporter, permease protein, 3-TM region, His/Glu/Gln/Arg/opine family [Leptolyngbyaceae cyanobacterium JSC-12]|nr:amine acid ABC transporter, permease protein, 3-TM region, His/Glu/Gln/Arg/opine family [Leptolyngbyaceae cyanobacterium JSC-12]